MKLSVLFAVVLWSLTAVCALAQDALTVAVDAGFGGYYRPGEWCPINVTINNRPTEGRPGDASLDFRGQLIVESGPNKADSVRFVRDVTVPAYSTQRFTLHAKFPEKFDATLLPTLLIRADNGKRLSEVPLEIQPVLKSQILQVAVMSDLKLLRFPMLRGEVMPVTQAVLAPEALPDHWASLDAVDVLVFPGWPDQRLTPSQIEALRNWVIMGGTLVFLGGANTSSYAADGPGNELLPMESISGSRSYRAQGGQFLPVPDSELNATGGPQAEGTYLLLAEGEPSGTAETLLNFGSLPVLVRGGLGTGQILFLAMDLETMPELARQALAPIWAAVLPVRSITDWRYQWHDILQRTKTVVGSAARPPNLVVIILICILYTVLVGPVNFYLLGKQNRVQLAWLTVPVIVLVFSGLIYLFGSLTKGGNRIGRELVLLQGRAGENSFAARGAVSIFVPSAGDYVVRPKDPSWTSADLGSWWEQEEFLGGGYIVDSSAATGSLGFTDTTPVVRDDGSVVAVDRWPLRTFDTTQIEVRGPQILDGAIEADLTYTQDVPVHRLASTAFLEGSLRNGTGLQFTRTALLLGGKEVTLGPLKDGESFTFTGSSRPAFAYGGVYRQMTHPSVTQHTAEPFAQDDVTVGRENSATLLSSIFAPQLTGAFFPPMDAKCYFAGWVGEEDGLSVTVNMERDLGKKSTVVLVEIPLKLPSGATYTLPPNLVQPSLVSYNGLSFQDDGRTIELFQGDAIMVLETPFESPGLRLVSVAQAVDYEGNDSLNFNVKLFQLGSATWARMDPNVPLRAQPNQSALATPYNARGWVLLESVKKDEGSNFTIATTTINDLNFEVTVQQR